MKKRESGFAPLAGHYDAEELEKTVQDPPEKEEPPCRNQKPHPRVRVKTRARLANDTRRRGARHARGHLVREGQDPPYL